MNRFWNLRCGIILSVFVALTFNSFAARPVENRYLFIVETSSAMKRDSEEAQRILLDLVFSGLHGRMKLNDSFGVWTYSAQMQGRLPMQYWNPEEKYSIAQNVAEFIKAQKFKGEGHLEEPLLMATKIAAASSNLTVIVISDGKQAITGTPFDHDIADLQKKYRDDLYKSKIPFVTVLVSNQGQWIDYSVNSSIGAIQIPELPLPPPPPVVAPVAVAPPPPRKKVEPLILIWPKTNTVKAAATTPATNAPAAIAPVANPATNNPVPTATPLTNAAINTNASASAVPATAPVSSPPAPPAAPQISTVKATTPPTPVVASTIQPQAAVSTPTPAKPASPPPASVPAVAATVATPVVTHPAESGVKPIAIVPAKPVATAPAPSTEIKSATSQPNATAPAVASVNPAVSQSVSPAQAVTATVAPSTPATAPAVQKASPPIAVPVGATTTPPPNNRIVLIAAVLALIGAGTLLLMRVVGRKNSQSSLITQSLNRQNHHDAVK